MPATDEDTLLPQDTLLPFSLPNIRKNKVTAAFDGGQVSSDGRVFLLAGADKHLGLIGTLARHRPVTPLPISRVAGLEMRVHPAMTRSPPDGATGVAPWRALL